MARTLNKMTKAGMPESVRIAWNPKRIQRGSPEIWFIQQIHFGHKKCCSTAILAIPKNNLAKK